MQAGRDGAILVADFFVGNNKNARRLAIGVAILTRGRTIFRQGQPKR